MVKHNINSLFKDWLKKNYSQSKNGKSFYTRYDVIKSMCEENNLAYEKVDKLITKNKQLNNELNDWLNNNLWHTMIYLKIPKGIDLYIENEVKLKPKKNIPEFLNDVKSHKQKTSAFTMNNDQENIRTEINETDKIFNLGTEDDFVALDIPIEEFIEGDDE